MGSSNPLLDRLNKPGHLHGQKGEKKTAKRLGGQARAGSGAIEGYKGDITLDDYLVENKTTVNKSISLKQEWLDKISREARAEGRIPALAIQFVDQAGNSAQHGRWVMIPENDFSELIDVT